MASTSSSNTAPGTRARRTPIQLAALIVGAVFLLVGLLGFVPGITTNFDTIQFASHDSGALLLGIFQVSILHNLVHLLFGVWGVAASRTAAASRSFLLVGGVLYLVLFIYGLLVPMDSSANFVPMNNADDVLHILLAIGMIGLGVLLSRRTTTTTGTAAR